MLPHCTEHEKIFCTLQTMSTGYKIKDQEGVYYFMLQVVHWADVFTRQIYRDIVIDGFRYCKDNKGLDIFAFVIMSNHIHLLTKSYRGELSDTVRDFKRHTSKKIVEQILVGRESRREWLLSIFEPAAKQHKRNNKYQFWTHENHPEHIYSNKFIAQKIIYIHENPVRGGIVESPEEYIYSSAKAYAGEDCILDVTVLTLPWIMY